MEQIWIKDGKFSELPENEVANLEVGQKAAYMMAKNSDNMSKLEAKIEEKAGEDVVKEIKGQIGELKEKHFDMLESAVKEQGKEIARLRKEGKEAIEAPKSFDAELRAVWKSSDVLKNFISGEKRDGFNLELKTEVTRASVSNNTMAHSIMGVGEIPRRLNSVSALFSTGTIDNDSNGVIRYWDQDSFTNNATEIAESAAYPESEIEWIQRTLDVRKIGDSIPVTREALEDVGFVSTQVRNLINNNVFAREDRQSLLGDGTGQQLTGVDAVAPNWAAGAFATSIDDASIYDVLSTGIVQIANAGENNVYAPTAIVMNPTDVELMRLAKDADGNYIMPMWMTADGRSVRGVQIVETSLCPQNQAYIGDFNFGTMYGTGGINIDVATQHGTDWLDDVQRLKASIRRCLVIRNVDAGAFLHVADIAAAQAALETP